MSNADAVLLAVPDFDELGQQKSRPSNIWTGDEEARGVVEQLIHDAGYDPISAGGLENASTQEQGIGLIFAISQASGPFFYRMAAPQGGRAGSARGPSSAGSDGGR